MKKVILSLAVCAIAVSANAQQKGEVFLYGNVGYSSQKTTNTTEFGGTSTDATDKSSNFYINPGIGFQISEHLGLGLNVGYSHDKTETPQGTQVFTQKMNEFMVGPFVRYTQRMGEHFFTYTQLQAGYQHGKETDELTGTTGSNEDSYSGFRVGLFPAIGINISPCLAITGSIGGVNYDYKKWDLEGGPTVTNTRKDNNFDINLGQQFTLGVQLNFGHGHMHKGHHEPMDETRRMDTSDDENMDTDKKKKKSRKDDDE